MAHSDWLGQAAAGLEYIHGQGFIHGNLKATNTYLDAQGRVLLSEFGLSQPAGETSDPYRSPEQVQGGLVDKRTDVYALGVLLFELLTGGPPPAGVVASPRARRPDLPEAVERVVLKAMAQNPDQRFQSAAAFREALEQAVQVPGAPPQAPAAGAPAPTPTPAPTISQSVQVQQPKGANWAAIILAIVLVVVCLGSLFLILPNLLDGEGAAPPPEATLEQPTLEPLPTDPPQPTEPPDEPGEPPPSEQLPEIPEQLPEDPGGQLPDICGSIGGAGLLALFGVVASHKRRKGRQQPY